MRAAVTATMAILALGLLGGPPPAGADEVEDAVTNLLEKESGSVVLVEFDLQRVDGRGGQEVKLHGVVVGEDGLVLVTSARQVDPPVGGEFDKPEKIEVRFPGDVKKKARFVGKDEELNLALLRLEPEEESEEAPADEPPAAGEEGKDDEPPAADAEGKDDEPGEKEPEPLHVAHFLGDAAITPGEPLITLRRLSQLDDDLVTFETLRVSTVIPRPGLPTEYRVLGGLRGTEGCPVYTFDGELVGFVAASTQRGRGRRFEFVDGRIVPVRDDGPAGHPTRILHAKEILGFLADPERYVRRDSWLGVRNLQALTKPLAEAYGIEEPGGIVIGSVSVGSPAEAAGFQEADVIVAADGERVETIKERDLESFKRQVRLAKAGDPMTFRVKRNGDDGVVEVELKATLEESPLTEREVPEYHDEKFGLKLKPLTRDFLERSRLDIDTKGVRVTSVDSASWASIAGIRRGDVIRKMVLQPCENLEQYKEIMKKLLKTKDSEVCYNVLRSRKSLFLCVRPDWDSVVESD